MESDSDQDYASWSCDKSGVKRSRRSSNKSPRRSSRKSPRRSSRRSPNRSSRKSSGYQISAYTRAKARALHVQVRPSTRKGKKIDVFKNGKKVASVGAMGYNDFTTFSRQSKSKAAARRKAYHSRHQKDEHRAGSPGYYAAHLLW